MNKLITLLIYLFYGGLVLCLASIKEGKLQAQTRSNASVMLKNAEYAWRDFTEGRERQAPENYEKAANDIATLLKQVDEFNPNETKLWQAKSTLLKAYSIWLRDVFQHQWIVPPNEKKEVYQHLLTELAAQADIKILRSPNLLMQGLIQYALKNFKAAEVLYREALLEDSANPYLLQRLAKVYTQQGKYSEAASYLTQALELDPSNEESLGELSYVYLQTSRQEEALSLINKALEIDPNYARNLIVLAIILTDKGQIEESQQLYTKIRSLQPYYTFAYTNDASNFIKQKDYPKAAQILETLIQKNPYCSKAWSLMGDLYTYQNMEEEALKNYQECNEIDNTCLTDIGYIYYKKNEYKTALAYYEQAISQDSTNKYAHHWAGWCYVLTNQYKKAVFSFENAIQLDNQYAYAYNGLGITYEFLKDYPEAISMHEKAIEANTFENNNSTIQIGKLCALYAEDLLVVNQLEEALRYLQIGGKYQAHCQALATGLSYEKGMGLSQDYALAYQHYRQAAERHPYTAQASNFIIALYENQKITMDSSDYKVWKTIASSKPLRLSIPAENANQQQENVNIFLYEAYPAGVQPPTWEVQRLQEEKSFNIPEDVSQSLLKLYELAKKNKVSYIELTKYALEIAKE